MEGVCVLAFFSIWPADSPSGLHTVLHERSELPFFPPPKAPAGVESFSVLSHPFSASVRRLHLLVFAQSCMDAVGSLPSLPKTPGQGWRERECLVSSPRHYAKEIIRFNLVHVLPGNLQSKASLPSVSVTN